MGVCTTVALLAETVSDARAPLIPRHRLLVEILHLMPVYSDIYRLDDWGEAFQAVIEKDEAKGGVETGNLLWGIYVLGTYNMYAVFDVSGTVEQYAHLSRNLEHAGIKMPTLSEQDLSHF